MRTSAARASKSPQTRVNLYCNQCESQIGIFENEWVRLTTSYARSKEKGSNFGTDVGNRTQVVPSGGAQRKAAEGCTLSDVFCIKCSATVGQFCRGVPGNSQKYLMDKYFYKLSRVFLKDCQTMQVVKPELGFDEDGEAGGVASQRWSQTPKATPHTFSRPRSIVRQSTQPPERPADRKSPGDDSARSGRESRQSIQPESFKAASNDETASQSQFQQTPSSVRYSMPPERYSREQVFTPQPTYGPIAYGPPYMTPYPQTPFRSGTVPPQPTYAQPVYLQSPYHPPPPFAYPTYQQPIVEMQPQPVQQQLLQPQPASEAELQVARIRANVEGPEETNIALQRHRAEQDTRLQEQDLTIAALGDKMDTLLGELREIRSDMGLKRIADDHSDDFINNFETMVRAVRALNSQDEEVKALRAENESMKTRFETIASAMSPLQSSTSSTLSRTPLSHRAASPASLGKRKRDDNLDRRTSLLQYGVSVSDVEPHEEAFENQLEFSKRRRGEKNESYSQLAPDSHGNDKDQNQPQMEDSLFIADSPGFVRQQSPPNEEPTQMDDSLFMLTPSQTPSLAPRSESNEETQEVSLERPTMVNGETSGLGEVHLAISSQNIAEILPLNSITPAEESSMISLEDDSNIVDSTDFSDDEIPQQQRAAQSCSELLVRLDRNPTISKAQVNTETHAFENIAAELSATASVAPEPVIIMQAGIPPLVTKPGLTNPVGYPSLAPNSAVDPQTDLPHLLPKPVTIGQTFPPRLVSELISKGLVEQSLTNADLRPPPLSAYQTDKHDGRPGTSSTTHSEQTDGSINDYSSVTGSEMHERSTSSKKGGPTRRRVTDSVVNHASRSMAPEPVRRRRTYIRAPKPIDLEDAFVATPETIRLKIENKGKPRVPQPKMQTSEKVLNKELKALGLSEWIGKDKTDPVYKLAVDTARKREREAKKLQKLSEKGLNVVQNNTSNALPPQPSMLQGVPTLMPASRPALETANTNLQRPSPAKGRLIAPKKSVVAEPAKANPSSTLATRRLSTQMKPPAAESNSTGIRSRPTTGKTTAQVKATAKQPSKVDVPIAEVPETTSRGMQTRRQQRAGQLRQRDLLAQEAMEREETAVAK